MDRFEVRKQIEKDLESAGLLERVEDYDNKVGFSERTHVPIEPKLSMQWFLKMDALAKPALDAVMQDDIKFHPSKFKNVYRHWMTNIKDWCISRQLWWGHRIPAYFLPQGGFVVAETAEEALALAKEKTGNAGLTLADLRQDEDCLDMMFSYIGLHWGIAAFIVIVAAITYAIYKASSEQNTVFLVLLFSFLVYGWAEVAPIYPVYSYFSLLLGYYIMNHKPFSLHLKGITIAF